MDLKILKVKIGLKVNAGSESGQAKYPNFNTMDVVSATGMDWGKYISVYGEGIHYDRTSGHKDDTVGSPVGQQWCILLVPEAFANEAVAKFPDDCSIVDDAEAEAFWEAKVTIYESDQKIKSTILSDIKTKQDMSIALTAVELKAIDPADDQPGITKNHRKAWLDFKANRGITII